MSERPKSAESTLTPRSAWPVLRNLVVGILILVALPLVFGEPEFLALTAPLALLAFFLTVPGFYLNPPNMSRVMVLFGKYLGTVREAGFFWISPFTLKHKVSLKAHNVASEKIKVNDSNGNPIDIGAVVVWQVRDTAQAMFDVEAYANYVDIQIETAVRALASSHPYDEFQPAKEGEAEIVSLRGDTDKIAGLLEQTLGPRLDRAGIEVLEARLSHLAYAPEIASAMLQRQQAEAIIAARQKIVEGAVGMVEQALNDLSAKGVVELDPDRRAHLVGNLLVVLCGQSAPQPVLNAGSI
ncbi:MAG TPA: SPFH domain-containing protein [Planctomycetota bacterium]